MFPPPPPSPPMIVHWFWVQVTILFKKVCWKVIGPGGISAFLENLCEGSSVSALNQQAHYYVPLIWNTFHVTPVPRNHTCSKVNDHASFWLVAPTLVAMNCFGKLVTRKFHVGVEEIVMCLTCPSSHTNTNDVLSMLLTLSVRLVLKHQEYSCMNRARCVDFSSAFNTIQPHIRLEKVKPVRVNPFDMKWNHLLLSDQQITAHSSHR